MSRSQLPHLSEHSTSGEKLSLLAVFAHPEDEAFGPAGTLAKYANEGIHVSLVTATRGPRIESDIELLGADECSDRDRSCACRTSGIRRACFLGYQTGELDTVEPSLIEDQLVRLMREIRPQVVITYSANGFVDDADHKVINRATTNAFRDAGNAFRFPNHLREGLAAYTPQKLYYCVLPNSFIQRWGIEGLSSIPDQEVTTVLDVSSHSQSMNQTLFCQRSHSVDFTRWLGRHPQVRWDSEYYALAESTLSRKPHREKDLFAGLR